MANCSCVTTFVLPAPAASPPCLHVQLWPHRHAVVSPTPAASPSPRCVTGPSSISKASYISIPVALPAPVASSCSSSITNLGYVTNPNHIVTPSWFQPCSHHQPQRHHWLCGFSQSQAPHFLVMDGFTTQLRRTRQARHAEAKCVYYIINLLISSRSCPRSLARCSVSHTYCATPMLPL